MQLKSLRYLPPAPHSIANSNWQSLWAYECRSDWTRQPDKPNADLEGSMASTLVFHLPWSAEISSEALSWSAGSQFSNRWFQRRGVYFWAFSSKLVWRLGSNFGMSIKTMVAPRATAARPGMLVVAPSSTTRLPARESGRWSRQQSQQDIDTNCNRHQRRKLRRYKHSR